MRLGYNTNGLAFHRWQDAISLIHEAGYNSVAITVDHYCLNPYLESSKREVEKMNALLSICDLRCVVETGTRFLLNPRQKHEPTLMSPTEAERAIRIDFLKRCINLACELEADAVSFWSGTLKQPLPRNEAMQRLVKGLVPVIDHAENANVKLAFEPEPGMFIESLADFAELQTYVSADHFGLTIDIGHLHCNGETPIADHLTAWKDRIFNLHIEDMCAGVHEHLMFGEGEIDFPPIMQCLRDIGYTDGLHVELSRHSHMAPVALRQSFEFLTPLI